MNKIKGKLDVTKLGRLLEEYGLEEGDFYGKGIDFKSNEKEMNFDKIQSTELNIKVEDYEEIDTCPCCGFKF